MEKEYQKEKAKLSPYDQRCGPSIRLGTDYGTAEKAKVGTFKPSQLLFDFSKMHEQKR